MEMSPKARRLVVLVAAAGVLLLLLSSEEDDEDAFLPLRAMLAAFSSTGKEPPVRLINMSMY